MRHPFTSLAGLGLALLALLALITSTAAYPTGGAPGAIDDPALEKKTLTAANFKSELDKGMTLVEFYSPYCIHCKRFSPTFASLADIQEHLEEFGFRIRRVNCVASGDLCAEQHVTGYPTLSLFHKDNKVEEYKGDRSFEDLMAYTTAKSSDYRKSQQQQQPMLL